RVLFVIFPVPLPALSLAQAPGIPLTRLSEFARPPLYLAPSEFAAKHRATADAPAAFQEWV
ncbi:hypothetical protein, partial [Burkholderia pseudomallei]|uniref:hypothetical protein n=1 Tax=Burkholderia pseudomallei TaxID=28450 RepID=UPI0011C4CF35